MFCNSPNIIPFNLKEKEGVIFLYNIFSKIKERLHMQDVARFYGLQMNRSGMACCPFHEDKTPSLKVYEENYYCFGCTSSGDATRFVAKLYHISQFEAAMKINSDFGFNLTKQEFATSVKSVLDGRQKYLQWEKKAFLIVSEYYKLLQQWRIKFAPVKQTDML